MVRNHTLIYRPLRGGIAIVAPAVNRSGTLGLIATDDGSDRWLVSACRVLCPPANGPAADDGSVYQPSSSLAPEPVAGLAGIRADPSLDCAAARLHDGVVALPEILGLGPVCEPADPLPGMRVVKAGIASGLTEGVVQTVSGDEVVIGRPAGFPSSYELATQADVGAVWVWRDTHRPVALQVAIGDAPADSIHAVRIAAVLAALDLRVYASRFGSLR
jgi:hypothetical protein